MFIARTFEARHFTLTHGSTRNLVLLAKKPKRSSFVFLSQPMKTSRDFTDHTAEPQPRQATGLSSIKAMYLR